MAFVAVPFRRFLEANGTRVIAVAGVPGEHETGDDGAAPA
jgi:hypothetical protein